MAARILLSVVVLAVALAVMQPELSSSEIHLRWNQAGYAPDRAKVLVAMSDADLQGHSWRIEDTASAVVGEGRFAPSVAGIGDHTPLPFNHDADFSALTEPGVYRFVTEGAEPARIIIAEDPYAELRPLPLRHLRVMRSGTRDVLLRQPSHMRDAQAPVWVPDGDPANGRWKPAEPARTVDVLGGWYDAGDQLKFTLNIAYTTYHLLLAYRLDPKAHARVLSRSDRPDILDEARQGLEFLMRVHPDRDTFIIQVGDERDHEQPLRLPEHDRLDGQRPALSALSRAHMGGAAAALALGARTWRQRGDAADAQRYGSKAQEIYERALQPDTMVTAFERGKVNDFYRDPTDADQMALASAELQHLMGDAGIAVTENAPLPPSAGEVSWGDWNWLANAAFAQSSPAAAGRLHDETARYAQRAAGPGQPWGIPGAYVWGSLHRWIGAANAAKVATMRIGPSPEGEALFLAMLDYTFGRNNWGVSFLFDQRLPNTVRHIYSPAYDFLGEFPTGALSEGPGGRRTHDALKQHFHPPADDPLARFDTTAAVFADDGSDFMCQESTIGGQADIELMLTLAGMQ